MPKILIVEDHRSQRAILEQTLSVAHDVQVLDSGKTAASTIETFKPDLILLDLIMPDVSGFEVMDELQARAPEYLGRTVVMTGLDEERAREQCSGYEPLDYLFKPLDIAAVFQLVSGLAARNAA